MSTIENQYIDSASFIAMLDAFHPIGGIALFIQRDAFDLKKTVILQPQHRLNGLIVVLSFTFILVSGVNYKL